MSDEQNWLDRCHFGDVSATMRAMIGDGVKVQTIVTSPPYWGLRSYLPDNHPDKPLEIGQEPTLREFIDKLVGVFELCRELLADDGTAWVNMGDSYSGGGCGARDDARWPKQSRNDHMPVHAKTPARTGLPPKNLMGQPWRLAFALQDAGWNLRQDIIWHKPNPMPESVTDRCTKAHEYLFLLSKSERYYFDQVAILEPVSLNTHARLSQDVQAQIGSARANGGAKSNGTMRAVGRKVYPGTGVGFGHGYDAISKPRVKNNVSFDEAMAIVPAERNRRSVWTIPTQSYSGAHFATFPEKLVEPCVLAGSRGGDTVFDPFFGSGTTGAVAQRLGRHFIGCELNRDNDALQRERLRFQYLPVEVMA